MSHINSGFTINPQWINHKPSQHRHRLNLTVEWLIYMHQLPGSVDSAIVQKTTVC